MSTQDSSNFNALLSSIAAAPDQAKQFEIFGRFLQGADRGATSTLLGETVTEPSRNMLYGKLLLMLMDTPATTKYLERDIIDRINTTVSGSPKHERLAALLEKTRKLKKGQVPLFKAKLAMFLQLLFLLQERVADEGLPPVKVNVADLADRILEEQLETREMAVDLNQFGKAYWNTFVDILGEADFRTDDKIVYTMQLSPSLIDQYATGSNLTGGAKGQGGQSALSDAMVARLGRNIIKRLGLLLRTIKMYQSADHPSVTLGLEALFSTTEEVLKGRESLTLTRMGSDLLIDDVKNRKKEKFIDDFVEQLDERNVNSITFNQGVSVEELRAMCQVFAMNQAQVKKAGGVKTILDNQGVTHIMVDQFKYGIIDAEQDDATASISADEKMIENIVFTELVGRLKDGKSIGDLKSEDVGAAFKQLLTGAFRKDKNAKQSLAQMLLAIDPDLAEKALFSKGGVRDDLNWATARRTIDQLIDELPKGSGEEKIRTIRNLTQMADLAISKNKDNSLAVITEKILARFRLKERDMEVMHHLAESLVEIAKSLVVNGKYTLALPIFRNMIQVKQRCEHMPDEKKEPIHYAIPVQVEEAFESISTPEVVEALVRELSNDSLQRVDTVIKILEILGSEEVVRQLLDGFSNDSRSVRNRCFQTLQSIGGKTLSICRWKLESIGDPEVFPREDDGSLYDEGFYVSRNAVELLAKIGNEEDVQVLYDLAQDKDSRLRRVVLQTLARISPEQAASLARMTLHNDEPPEMVKTAIAVLGTLKDATVEQELIEMFYAEPQYRQVIVDALSKIGGADSEELMLGATRIALGGNLGRIYRQDSELQIAAIKGVGQFGDKRSLKVLGKYVRALSNPILRILFLPFGLLKKRKDLLKIARDAHSRVQFRLKKAS